MVAKQWFRLYREIISDPKLRRVTPGQRWLWVVILCLATDHDGTVQMSSGVGYEPSDLSDLSGIPPEEVSSALLWFEKSGMVKNRQNTVFSVEKWNSRQFVSDTSTDRVRKFRRTKAMADSYHDVKHSGTKRNVSEAHQSRAEQSRSSTPIPPLRRGGKYTQEFDLFWSAYPANRRTRKHDAFTGWKKVGSARPPIDDLLSVLERLKESDDWVKDGGQYVPHPSKWLRGHGWEDDVGDDVNESPSATLNAEAPHFGTDPRWQEYQRLVLGKKIEPGFVAWTEESDGDV